MPFMSLLLVNSLVIPSLSKQPIQFLNRILQLLNPRQSIVFVNLGNGVFLLIPKFQLCGTWFIGAAEGDHMDKNRDSVKILRSRGDLRKNSSWQNEKGGIAKQTISAVQSD
jgi:hypothetical protein